MLPVLFFLFYKNIVQQNNCRKETIPRCFVYNLYLQPNGIGLSNTYNNNVVSVASIVNAKELAPVWGKKGKNKCFPTRAIECSYNVAHC